MAVPLTERQRERLIAALAGAYGHEVHLDVIVDPRVKGGISVQIGDEFIDGSVASRLADTAQAPGRLMREHVRDGAAGQRQTS